MPVKCESDVSAVRLLKEQDPDQLYGAVRHIKNRLLFTLKPVLIKSKKFAKPLGPNVPEKTCF